MLHGGHSRVDGGGDRVVARLLVRVFGEEAALDPTTPLAVGR